MVNVYTLSKSAAAAPAGWTEIAAGYQDKLVLLSGTPLDTAGNDTHNTHTATLSTGTQSANCPTNLTSPNWSIDAGTHTHTVNTPTQGAGNHLPPYKNLRCFYRTMTGWNGKLPTDSIVFYEAAAPQYWAEYDNGSSYFIRLSATAEGTGGATSHLHSLSGTLANYATTSAADTAVYTVANLTHGHSYSGNSANSAASDFYSAGAGLITNTADAFVKKDMILLFNGDPGAAWSAITATDRLLKKSTALGAWAIGGTHLTWSHTHNVSFESGACNSTTTSCTSSGTSKASGGHTHTISGTLGALSVTPSYVILLAYKALNNFNALHGQAMSFP